MEERAASSARYYESYQGMRSDLASQRESELERIALTEARGSYSASQAGTARAQAERAYTEGLEQLQQGPTYELLRNEYEDQRAFAQQQYDRAGPQAGPIRYRSGGGDRAGESVEVLPQAAPEDTRAPFEFASFDEFWQARSTPSGGGTARDLNQSRARMTGGNRPRGGGDVEQGVTVGQIYSWS